MSKIIKWRRLGLATVDALVVALALLAAYYLRFDGRLYRQDWNQYVLVVGVFVIVRLIAFWAFRLYQGVLRYAGLGEMLAIAASIFVGSAVLFGLNVLFVRLPLAIHFPVLIDLGLTNLESTQLRNVPRLVIIIESLLSLFGVALVHFSRRIVIYQVLNIAEESGAQRPRRLLLVGAGDLADTALRQVRSSPNRQWKTVAVVDDDVEKHTLRFHGMTVEGGFADIPEVIRRHGVEDVLVAVKNISPEKLQQIVAACDDARVRLQILPSVQDVMSGRVSLNQIRPVEIEDLLGRDPVRLTIPDEHNYIRDKVVMITGAGGSIGSELCRQLILLRPRQIIMFGHGENSIYEITQELARDGHGKIVEPIIGDIRDRAKLRKVIEEYHPSIFFHAAAHKHVPLMEAHPEEAIKNNVAGTRNVAELADEFGADRFILISSDKAVRPTNVMGATKRLAEMIIFCMARKSKTLFCAVRFGNVLGSRGSVVPLFRRQIAAGGPITITSPDVTRYFMTIPEAVSLVIQAASMNQQRRLFLLDMGQPVKIVDLARNLIRLSGFEPDKDIQIVFTGLRPGEKLKEELVTAGENITPTEIHKLFVTEPEDVDDAWLRARLESIVQLADENQSDAIKAMLDEMVPDYGPEAEEAEPLPAAATS